MKAKARQRARGKAYECACGEEKLRLTRRGPDARHEGWSYLYGECGGGVKLRFAGVEVVEVRDVRKEEADRIRSLPARRVDPYGAVLSQVDERSRRRLEEIVAGVREAIQEGTAKWMAAGELLSEAKRILPHGQFGVWVQHNGMDPHNANRLITAAELARALPGFSSTLRKMGQEKIGLLARLPHAKRIDALQDGVPVDGKVMPIEDVTHRQLNAYVRSIVGKDPRGRKAKAKDEPKRSERFGIPMETLQPLQDVLKGLQALKKQARAGWPQKLHVPIGRLWKHAYRLAYELHDDLGMGSLLDDGRVIDAAYRRVNGGGA